jgi:hypothetical protein
MLYAIHAIAGVSEINRCASPELSLRGSASLPMSARMSSNRC